MNGKVCLVTGATDGIGKVTVRALAHAGAAVVGVGRNPAKIEAVRREIGRTKGTVDFLSADLSSLSEIRALADEFRAKYNRLDVLINNAGALFTSYRETVDGIEMTFALNHLSYFLLTDLLLDVLKASTPSRIINVASNAHEGETINFADLGHKRDYGGGWTTYGQSKLANILFTYELARRLDGTGVTVNAVHPGFVNSNFQKAAGLTMRGSLTNEEGADTQIWMATAPELEGVTGKYFIRRREARSSDASHDAAVAKRLWDASAQMVDA
jgi:NAD(P)-dependent dehydrogenase (short-subunit alcohol dehydrogenase family)